MDSYTTFIENKESLNKMLISFKSRREFLYSGWEINQITSTLNNVYYKNELINTIKSLLMNGTDPKDIYILNSSVKVGRKYESIKNGQINLQELQGIMNLFRMGSPIPLYPNVDTLKIYSIFEILKVYFKRCKSLGLTTPNRKRIIHDLYNNRNEITNVDLLKDYLKNEIYGVNVVLEAEELDEKIKKLIRGLESSLKQLEIIINDLELLEQFNKYYSESIEEGLKQEKFMVLCKYFNMFKKTFNKLERPFICVHKRTENNLYISNSDLIAVENFTEDNYRFFETKTISQNSPLIIAICVGIGFAPSILKIGESLIKARRTLVEAKRDTLRLKEENDLINIEMLSQNEELNALKREIIMLDNDIENLENNTTENVAVNEAKDISGRYTTIDTNVDTFMVEVVNSLEVKNNGSLIETLVEKKLNLERVRLENNEAS